MLDNATIRKVEEFVFSKPRSMQEIAKFLGKNWRTVDRYIEEIKKNFGTIDTRTFREGTRGALKIVYWSSIEKVSSSIFQQKIEEEIMKAKRKEDFSAFDIFQHVKDSNKNSRVVISQKEEETAFNELSELFKKTEKQLLVFSGNLSFINFKNKNQSMLDILDGLLKKKISIKILCRVDLVGKENIEKVLSLNFKHGKETVEIRHREHPIRATIFDKRLLHIKEIKEPTGKISELDKKIFIYYTIRDREWVDWVSRVFWKMFASSIDANKRLQELNKISSF